MAITKGRAQFKLTHINWDADSSWDLEDLPTEVYVTVDLDADNYIIDAQNIILSDSLEELLSDYLTNTYGFCHCGFNIWLLNQNEFNS